MKTNAKAAANAAKNAKSKLSEKYVLGESKHPAVTLVGIGADEQGIPCVEVGVKTEEDRDVITEKEVDGVPVRVIVTSTFEAL